jgi:hypothetical protein
VVAMDRTDNSDITDMAKSKIMDKIIPVFTKRDFEFIADMMVDIAYLFSLDDDDLNDMLGMVCDGLKMTNNGFKEGTFRDWVRVGLEKKDMVDG